MISEENDTNLEDEAPARGRARSRSFRSEEEEMLQRGVVPPSFTQTEQTTESIGVTGETTSDSGDSNTSVSQSLNDSEKSSVKSSTEGSPGSSSNPLSIAENRRNSDERLVVNKKNRPQHYAQIRDVGGISQKTINSVRNLQDPAKFQQQHREKTEAELAEEELERNSLSKGFLTTTQYDYYVKILLLGDSGVGKTSLMLRFADNKFEESLIGTAGVDFKVRYLDKDGIKTKCQIWDTAGQEKFHVITRAYYRGAHGIALVFDCSDINTFNKIGYWMENIKNHASEDVFLILLANKVDIPGRQVSVEQGKLMAEKHGYHYFETSAKTGSNVVEAFETLSDHIVTQLQKKEEKIKAQTDSSAPLKGQQKNIIQGKKNGCCIIS